MKQTWSFYDHETRKLKAAKGATSRWIEVEDGGCETVIYLSEEQVRKLLVELRLTIEESVPAAP